MWAVARVATPDAAAAYETARGDYEVAIAKFELCIRSRGLDPEMRLSPTGVFYNIGFSSPGTANKAAADALINAQERAIDECTTQELMKATAALEKIVSPSEDELRSIAASCSSLAQLPAGPIEEVLSVAAQSPGGSQCIMEQVAVSIKTRFGG